ncbi:MAG TPA: hypothetical protein VMT19_13305 [Thermoanaerobaculaceae bacterium]|nr:hypothetical protein [Thermoanaerobaculaceae bacterium]
MTDRRFSRMVNPLALALAVAAVCFAGVAAWLPGQVLAKKVCCIAGNYRGSQAPNPLPNCPPPKTESFSMTISQGPVIQGCGTDVWGDITDASGHVNHFKGTLRAGERGCCIIDASFSDPGHPGHLVKFTGTFCQDPAMHKWHAKGTFTEANSGDPCKKGGVWKIDQI